DLVRLQPGVFLNDELIEAGLRFLTNDLLNVQPWAAGDIFVFSSFFYSKLKGNNAGEPHKNLHRWTKRVNIFEKKYVLVPINEDLHWYLLVVINPGHMLGGSVQTSTMKGKGVGLDAPPNGNGSTSCPATSTLILSMDSLGRRRPKVTKMIESFLQSEATFREFSDCPSNAKGVHIPVPMQPNLCDCGLYLLQNAKTFINNRETIVDSI
ncbi:cysteine proteinase, partial [Rickenella mellea]